MLRFIVIVLSGLMFYQARKQKSLKTGAVRSKDGSLHTDQSAALITCAEDMPLTMRRRSLTEARHFHCHQLSSLGTAAGL
jgi:hypothetical protein